MRIKTNSRNAILIDNQRRSNWSVDNYVSDAILAHLKNSLLKD